MGSNYSNEDLDSYNNGDDNSTEQDLKSFLFECADIIRNRVGSSEYKEYILPLVFYKAFNDTYQVEYEQRVEEELEDGTPKEVAEKIAHDEAYHDVVVPKDYMWSDLLNADNPATEIDDALREFQACNEQFTAITELDNYADVSSFSDPEDNSLEELLRHLDARDLGRENVAPDVLGEAYMYLVRQFALEEGKDGGEFFTPPEIVSLMVKILEPYEKNADIHDPTVGAGGMLVEVANHLKNEQEVDEEHWRSTRFTGQEINESVQAISEMNLAIHDAPGEIKRGDSLVSPQFTTGPNNNALESFDYVLANFPFSVKKWKSGTQKRQERFGDLDWHEKLPNGNYGDFAFIMHMYSQLSDSGRLATVIPHGVLFRNGDQPYRQHMIDEDIVEAVIGLPENLFQGTGIPAGILVLNNDKPAKSEGEVLFFNADHEDRFYDDTGSDQSILRESNTAEDGIGEIKHLFDSWVDEERVCRVVDTNEIKENEYNMNIALYVDTTEPQENINVENALASVREIDREYKQLNQQFSEYMNQLNYEGDEDE